MSLYNTIKDFGGKTIVTGSLIAMLVGCQPTLEQIKDLTGDGIPDAIVKISHGNPSGTWLFIGQEDGSFIRAKQNEEDGVKYFKAGDEKVYFFDGNFYKLSPKRE